MAMRAPRCPRHKKGTLEDCPWCEAEAERQEMLETYPEPDPERSDAEAARYEQWLDRCFEG